MVAHTVVHAVVHTVVHTVAAWLAGWLAVAGWLARLSDWLAGGGGGGGGGGVDGLVIMIALIIHVNTVFVKQQRCLWVHVLCI